MTNVWKSKRLKDVADVRVSNVDKKSIHAELPVHLCNYMDVYGNDYVISCLPFMAATATRAEIQTFGLRLGDVMITKDSESPDDIGIPSVVVDEIDNLVCGYHLALIRPKAEEACPVYLAKQLAAEHARRYFGINASGSTRFGIPVGAIENLELPLPEAPEQSKIAEVLSTVDRAIAQTEALIAKQQRIKTGLMQDLLTRGIDEHGQLRSEATHRFKDSPVGRIPVEWDVVEFAKVANINRGKFTHRPRDDARFYGGPYPFIQTGDVGANVGRTVDTYSQTLSARGVKVSKEFPKGTIAITIAANIADTAILGRPMYFPDSVVGAIVKKPNCTRFIEMVIRSHKPALEQIAPKSAQSNINLEVLRPLLVVLPDPEEQTRIAATYAATDKQQESDEDSLRKHRSLKTALMQDLLTGKVRVTPLLEQAEAATA